MLTGSWQSIAYQIGVSGTYTIELSKVDDNRINAIVLLKYDNTSPFRTGTTKSFKLRCVCDDVRILGQSELAMEQLFNFTFKFDTPVTIGHYSTIFPIDCGTMRSDQTRSECIDVIKHL